MFTVKWAVDEAAETGSGVGLGLGLGLGLRSGLGLGVGLAAGLCSRDRVTRGECVLTCVVVAWAVVAWAVAAGATRFTAVGAALGEVAENVAAVTARPRATAPAAKMEKGGMGDLKDLWGAKGNSGLHTLLGSPLNVHHMA